MVKRKAEKQHSVAPMSAVAARRARQQQAQNSIPKANIDGETMIEPPPKRPRRSVDAGEAQEPSEAESRGPRTRSSKKQNAPLPTEIVNGRQKKATRPKPEEANDEKSDSRFDGPEYMGEDEVASIAGDIDGYESPADTSTEPQNFPLSKARLNKSNVVYADEGTLCVRVKEKMNLTLLGQYDIWVKRGVISLMGAKLYPSSRAYRVYAPSTHSLPVIKCVSGVNGEAEVELKSCHNGLARLRDISPLYQRIWSGQNSMADKLTLEGAATHSRRSFSVLYASADDSLKRHLRPLHLDKKWSASMKALSQRQGRLRVLVCGPKASGKSTFARYLLNHVMSPTPEAESGYVNTDGVAFLDLDPGQPEFAPMGQVYLAHLMAPFFGPPFTHPSLDGSHEGQILRAHHIGATSPKEDPDHYAMATMDLLNQYHSLLARYPQCPLIVNYPGWIFGQGLEVATWLVGCLGLSDVVYMSEKGPSEVVEPLGLAASQARVPLTILPSQPTEFVSRSSAQLRSMQIQSYFHQSHSLNVCNPLWSGTPLARTRPIAVDYNGEEQGISGIMVMGSQVHPEMLREVIEGAIVAVVEVDLPGMLWGQSTSNESAEDIIIDSDEQNGRTPSSSTEDLIVRTPEGLPYIFAGSGSCTPLDPKLSNCLGLALVRSVNAVSHKLELSTPIDSSRVHNAAEKGRSIVLVRGQLDNPNWAISEDYHAARAAERRYQQIISRSRRNGDSIDGNNQSDQTHQKQTLSLLRERIRRASNVPWMTVLEDHSRRQREAAARREKSLWKLRKKAYPGSESETDW